MRKALPLLSAVPPAPKRPLAGFASVLAVAPPGVSIGLADGAVEAPLLAKRVFAVAVFSSFGFAG